MKIAQSYLYKGIPVTIIRTHNKGMYTVGDSSITVRDTDLNILKQLAEALADNKQNGIIFNTGN